ncbi:MAG: guanylate kinase [Acidimicrobiales bacterium]|nr:guanylate kinase [Acidimicrobiales bacterium]
MIIVISGPGGAGKGTLVQRLVDRDDALWLSQSWTTRVRRPGEAHDAYHFATPDEFQQRIDADGFLEWVDFLDYRQGTPRPSPPEGTDVVLEIDVVGGLNVAQVYADPLLIFVDTPTRDEQQRRMEERGDPADKVQARLERGDRERELVVGTDYITVINDDLETAIDEVAALISYRRFAGKMES